MGEYNRAIRTAQRLLRSRAATFPDVESGYQNYVEDPWARAYRGAAADLEPLIEEED